MGTEGFQKAADYVASQFQQLGLKPAGVKGYFQPIKFETYQVEREQSSLELIRNGQAQTLDLGAEASISVRGTGHRSSWPVMPFYRLLLKWKVL